MNEIEEARRRREAQTQTISPTDRIRFLEAVIAQIGAIASNAQAHSHSAALGRINALVLGTVARLGIEQPAQTTLTLTEANPDLGSNPRPRPER